MSWGHGNADERPVAFGSRPTRASSRLLLVTFALASTQLWCASEDTIAPPKEDADADGGAPLDAATPDVLAATPVCTASFCRVSFAGMEAVSIDALWARSPSDGWLVGATGFAARFDGTTWQRVDTGTKAALHGVVGTEDGTVWGAGSTHELLQLNRELDGKATAVNAGFKAMIDGLSASGSEIYAVGTTIKTYDFPPPETPPMPDNIWRYGPAADGGAPTWLPASPPCPMGDFEPECVKLRAVWVESSERQWFAGDEGKVFRTDTSSGGDGEAPGRLRLDELNSRSLRRLNGLWGFDGNDVWAVGDQGVLRHWNGQGWSVIASPVLGDLHGAWGARPDDVWAVGDDGTVIHWDGAGWTVIDVPFSADQRPRLRAVTGAGDDVWIAGEGVLLRATRGTSTGADR